MPLAAPEAVLAHPRGGFRNSISHRLTLLFGLPILGGLAIGGISVALAYLIVVNHHDVVREHDHVRKADGIHAAFHDLIFELHQIDSTGDRGRVAAALVMQEDISRELDELAGIHPGDGDAAEVERERALLAELRGLAEGARSLTARIRERGRLTAADLDWLNRTSHVVPRRVDDLGTLHRTRVALLLEQNRSLIRTIGVLYAVFLLVGVGHLVVVSAGLNRGIGAPLRRLAAAARSIAEGRLDARVRVASRDEIGQLSADFNLMAERLQGHDRSLRSAHSELEQKVREAQALHRIGTDIARLRRLDGTLQFVVDQARELLRCDVAALLLSHPGDGRPRTPVTSGPPEAFGTDAGEPAPPGTPEAELAGLICPIRPEFRRARLVIPLELRHDQRGVIVVACRDERGFTPADRELLSGLAAHAAIALETARLSDELRDAATLQERERLAREMHDGFAQSLALLNLKLQTALALEDAPPRVAQMLREMATVTQQAYQDVRQAILGLRTFVSRGLGLEPALTEYLHEFSAQNGIAVDLDVAEGTVAQLPPDSEVQVVRIIQEALVNVRKHAGVARARVRFCADGDFVRISVEDDGVGWDPAESREGPLHFGLQTMRERAEDLGGTLEVRTEPGRGTRVAASIPRALK
jgi:two-component system nitrate/nitrite sensor histidine kinase NarX